MIDINQVQVNIKYKFTNLKLLKIALTHRSYLHEKDRNQEITEHNERLEFLGDAVLELIVTEYIYAKFPDKDEGYLTALRSALVNYKTVGEVGNSLELDQAIFLSSGERAELGRARLTIVANAMEAILGAIYLDGGYDKAKQFVEEFILIKLEEVILNKTYKDPKTELQEYTQKVFKVTPFYKLLHTEGKDHEKTFQVAVLVDGKTLAYGEGKSKQDAESVAAIHAMEVLGIHSDKEN